MARKIVSTDDSGGFAVCCIHADQSVGWLLGAGERGTDVKTYPTKEAAEKAISQMKKNPRYSWNCILEAREFTGFGKRS